MSRPTSRGELRLTGVVEAGVEAGCLILRPDSGSVYLLLGGDSTVLVPGRRVAVRGLPQPDRVTFCMQGIPFEVREATPIQPVG